MANDRTLKSVRTCFDIVEALVELDGSGVSELAMHMDQPKTTAYEYLRTLKESGYLVKRDGEYKASARFISLAENIRMNYEIYEVAQHRIQNLANETEAVVNLMVEENSLGVILSVENTSNTLTKISENGTATQLHISAPGKAILSELPEDRVEEIISERGLRPMTEKTIDDRDTLLEELETIREQGYAMDIEESVDGIQGLGIPIVDRNRDEVAGSIGLYGPARAKNVELFRDQYLDDLIQVANTIEINLSYTG